MELRTYLWCVMKYTKTGDTILDPMSGVGTVHLATMLSRNSIGIELMPNFVDLQLQNISKFQHTDAHQSLSDIINEITPFGVQAGWELFPGIGSYRILQGDCRRHLPLDKPVDAVIFSPPYGDLWTQSKGEKSKVELEKNYNVGYGLSDANVGNYKVYPQYLKAMEIIYGKCFDSLKPGGILVTVVKDYIKSARRVYCSADNLKVCCKVGFVPYEWHLRDTSVQNNPFSAGNRAKRIAAGKHNKELDIMAEDIIVVRRPE